MRLIKIAISTSEDMGWSIERFINRNSVIDELICSICTDVLENPVQTPCQHSFCNDCIKVWVEDGKSSCPVDRQTLDSKDLKPARILQQLLNNLIIRCKHFHDGCSSMARFEDMPQLVEHEINQCRVVQYDSFLEQHERNMKDGVDKKKEIEDKDKRIEILETKLKDQKTLQTQQHAIDANTMEELRKIISEKDTLINNLTKKTSSQEKSIEQHRKFAKTISDQAKHMLDATTDTFGSSEEESTAAARDTLDQSHTPDSARTLDPPGLDVTMQEETNTERTREHENRPYKGQGHKSKKSSGAASKSSAGNVVIQGEGYISRSSPEPSVYRFGSPSPPFLNTSSATFHNSANFNRDTNPFNRNRQQYYNIASIATEEDKHDPTSCAQQ